MTDKQEQILEAAELPVCVAAEDESRPVVKFLRLARWPEERIAEVVAAHKRGESYEVTVTVGGGAPNTQSALPTPTSSPEGG